MKTNHLISGILLGAVTVISAATNDLTSAIQRGLFEEEANQNLGAAIQAYQAVASQFDKDRKLAATAIFRLGECYRKQGNTNDAATQYQRILREFSDQPTLVTLSRQNLAALGTAPPATAAPVLSDAARQEQKRLLEEEIKLVQKHSEEQQKQMQAGLVVSSDDRLATARDLLHLKRQIAALDAGLPTSFAAPETASPTSTEADEVRRIQALIKDSPDLINAPDRNGETLLQSAAAKGKLAVVKLLLDSGAAVDGLQQPCLTALHYAAGNGHKAAVDLLLSKGAKADAQTEQGITPLHLAARKGYEEVAKALLAAGAPVNGVGSGSSDKEDLAYQITIRQTPLHLAAAAGYAGLVDLLVTKGADVNAEDGAGCTPLSRAVERHSQPVVQRLLAAHANPNAGRADLPLAQAAKSGDVPALKLLLANGADPNTNAVVTWEIRTSAVRYPPGTKCPPLFLAVVERHPDAVNELLRFKADPNAYTPLGRRPLLWVALMDAPTLEALLDAGADPNQSVDGTPLLMQAAWDKNQPAVELLLAHHADVNCADNDGRTPLHAAASEGNKPVAELLLRAGAAVNAKDNTVATPLYRAVERRSPEVAALLLANKADPNVRNNAGQTPLDLAKSQGGASNPPAQESFETRLARITSEAGPKPVPMPGRPAAVPPPSVPVTTPREQPAGSMADLLRRNGALDDLPSLNLITVRRSPVGRPGAMLTKTTNDWNQFTLLDLIGMQYSLLPSSPDAGSGPSLPASSFFRQTMFPFPDLARIHISRPAADLKRWQEQVVDLSPIFGSADCAANRRLSWGDVVVIPEADHPLNEQWSGFSFRELANLKSCLARKVEVVVKGVAKSLTLAPGIYGPGEAPPGRPVISTREPTIWPGPSFWLKSALLQSKLVLVSSDLSRVKVTRRDPATGQERQWVVDCSEASPAPDFWLRDGDRIEVPEKGEASAAAVPRADSEPPK